MMSKYIKEGRAEEDCKLLNIYVNYAGFKTLGLCEKKCIQHIYLNVLIIDTECKHDFCLLNKHRARLTKIIKVIIQGPIVKTDWSLCQIRWL